MKLIKPVLAALAVLAVMSVISCKHPAAAADSVEDPEPAKPVYTDYTSEMPGQGTVIFKTVYWEIPEGVTIQKATLKSEKFTLGEDEPTEILERENCSTYDAFFKKIIDDLTDDVADSLGKAAASVTEEELKEYVLENSQITVADVPYLFHIAYVSSYYNGYLKDNVFYGIVDGGMDYTDPEQDDMFFLDMFGFTTDWEFSDGTIITTLSLPDIR